MTAHELSVPGVCSCVSRKVHCPQLGVTCVLRASIPYWISGVGSTCPCTATSSGMQAILNSRRKESPA